MADDKCTPSGKGRSRSVVHDGRVGFGCGSEDPDLSHWTFTGKVTCRDCHAATRAAIARLNAQAEAGAQRALAGSDDMDLAPVRGFDLCVNGPRREIDRLFALLASAQQPMGQEKCTCPSTSSAPCECRTAGAAQERARCLRFLAGPWGHDDIAEFAAVIGRGVELGGEPPARVQPTEQPSPTKEPGAKRCHVRCNNAAGCLDEMEVESPNFVPSTATELAARGYERVNVLPPSDAPVAKGCTASDPAPRPGMCNWYDEDYDDATSPYPCPENCSEPSTHYSCCFAGMAPNVCEKHKCRCKQPEPRTANPTPQVCPDCGHWSDAHRSGRCRVELETGRCPCEPALPVEMRTSPAKCHAWLAAFAHGEDAPERLAELLDTCVAETLKDRMADALPPDAKMAIVNAELLGERTAIRKILDSIDEYEGCSYYSAVREIRKLLTPHPPVQEKK